MVRFARSPEAAPSRARAARACGRDEMNVNFTYCRVPADEHEAPEELSASSTQPGDALPEILKTRFAGGSIKNADSLRAEYGSAVDEKMEQLNQVASQGSVEVFALVRPSAQTMPIPHAGTYFYFDEMGALKGLPVNKRAGQIAATCGLDVESPFLGDVYIGRVVLTPSPTRNGNFDLSELDSSSPFLRSAPSENAQYQMAMEEYSKAAKAKTVEGKARAGMGSGSDADGSPNALAAAATPSTPGQYKWAQTPTDLEVTLALPAGTLKRDVKVSVGAKSLKVDVRSSADANAPPLVDLKLFAAVRPDEMTWTLSGTMEGLPQLQVMVEKAVSVTWSRLEVASEGQIL